MNNGKLGTVCMVRLPTWLEFRKGCVCVDDCRCFTACCWRFMLSTYNFHKATITCSHNYVYVPTLPHFHYFRLTEPVPSCICPAYPMFCGKSQKMFFLFNSFVPPHKVHFKWFSWATFDKKLNLNFSNLFLSLSGDRRYSHTHSLLIAGNAEVDFK